MPTIIFLDDNSRVVGTSKSVSYTEDSYSSDPYTVFVGDNFDSSNMQAIYDHKTGTYTADEITVAYHTPPTLPPVPEE